MLEKLWKPSLEKAGITLNGPNPWDPQIKPGYEDLLALRVGVLGSLGLGESYMDKWWSCEDLVGFFNHILKTELGTLPTLDELLLRLKHRFFNMQRGNRAHTVGKVHYDLGNDLFEVVLDETLTYTCAFWWGENKTLFQAQEQKRHYSLEKLKLKPGMRLLEIGSGWGYLAKEAAEKYGVSVVGISVSEEQITFAKNLCNGLPVRFEKMDYRGVTYLYQNYFDRVISIGMFEQVGPKNYATFMEVVRQVLKPKGLMLLHTITGDDRGNPWLHKNIFPNGVLPKESSILGATRGKLMHHDSENFGLYYVRTLQEWRKNYLAGRHRLDPVRYDECFHRMWIFYLSMCESIFTTGKADLMQFVFSKGMLDEVYVPPSRG